jgi:hypothetical protein
MKTSHIFIAILLILGVFNISSCDTHSQPNEETSQVEIDESHSPLISPIPSSTSTPGPTETPPGLNPDELHTFVSRMLETNGDCELPCWWGIVPGETTWNDMENYFSGMGIDGGERGYLDLGYKDPETGHRIRLLKVDMEQKDALVHFITVTRDYIDQPRQADFSLDWQRYELSQVLSRHGAPSQVYLSLEIGSPCVGPGVVPTYSMWVEYKDVGMAILYTGILIHDLDDWLLCPVFGQTSDIFGPTRAIEIRLQAPDLDTPLVDLPPGDGEFIFADTLQELANMSMEEFYELFSESSPQSCALLDTTTLSSSSYIEKVLATGFAMMTPEEEDDFLVDMLTPDEDCELPCWWGITPGITTWQDAQQAFLSYGKDIGISLHLAGYPDDEGDYIPPFEGYSHEVSLFGRRAQYPFDYVVEHTFYEHGGTVQLLEVIGHALGGYTWYNSGWSTSQVFSREWHYYSLDQILARYGQPTQVLLHYWPYEGALYSLAVLYEDEGIMVAYVGPVHGEDTGENPYQLDTITICPTTDLITDINLWLKSPDLDDSLAQIYDKWQLGEGYYTLPFSEDRSPNLEDVTDMSLEEFYYTFLDPTTTICIQALGNLSDMLP